MSTRVYLLVLILLLLGRTPSLRASTPPSAPAEVIAFNNGDRLTGTVVAATSATLIFAHASFGNLTVNWTDLKSVEIHHKLRILSATGSEDVENATIAVTTSPVLALNVTESGAGTSTPIHDVQSVGDPPTLGWIVPGFTISAAFLSSLQHQQTYSTKINLVRTWNPASEDWPRERTRIELNPSYDEKRKNNKPGSATITQDYFGRFQQLFFFKGEKLFATATADLFRNNSLGIYFEQAYGGGVGTLLGGLELDADLRFIGEHFYSVSPSLGLFGTELEERYTFDLGKNCVALNKRCASVTETGMFTPAFNATGAWQTKAEVFLTVPMSAKFSFKADLTDNYIENAPPSFRKNYLKTTLGVSFTPAKH